MRHAASDLPDCFCWTKFGAEAGQSVERIFKRKEEERERNDGIFLWGIGNSLGEAVHELVRRSARPEILFSPIKAAPRSCDSDPGEVLAWRAAETMRGEGYDIPAWSLVTSRQNAVRPKIAHYALVCYSERPVQISDDGGMVDAAALGNLLTGHPLGASQVTAIVQRRAGLISRRQYPIAFRAILVEPFFVRLRDPIAIAPHGEGDWADAVARFWTNKNNGQRAARAR